MSSLVNETGLIWVDGKTLVVASSDVRDSNLTKKIHWVTSFCI